VVFKTINLCICFIALTACNNPQIEDRPAKESLPEDIIKADAYLRQDLLEKITIYGNSIETCNQFADKYDYTKIDSTALENKYSRPEIVLALKHQSDQNFKKCFAGSDKNLAAATAYYWAFTDNHYPHREKGLTSFDTLKPRIESQAILDYAKFSIQPVSVTEISTQEKISKLNPDILADIKAIAGHQPFQFSKALQRLSAP